MSDQAFRDLLAALNLEATYDPTKRELTVRVTLVLELTHPDGDRAHPCGQVRAHFRRSRGLAWR